MKSSLKLKALAAGAALLVGGQAFAQTNITTSSTGTLFLNVWDETAQTSYVVNLSDTSLGSSFAVNGFSDPAGPLTVNLSSDANYQSFLSSEGSSDTVVYSILGVVTTHNGNALDQTASSTDGLGLNMQLKNLTSAASSVINAINGIAASTTPGALSYSQFVTNTGNSANSNAYYGTLNAGLSGVPVEIGAVGSALNFYSITLGSPSSGSSASLVATAYNGTWDFSSNGLLSYGSAAVVPLPKSWILLLSGLLLMGVISRRGKNGAPAGNVLLPGAAA